MKVNTILKAVQQAIFPTVPQVSATDLSPAQWNQENLSQSGISLRNTLLASLITAIGFAAAIGVAYMLTNQTKASNAGMDAQSVVTGLTNAYGGSGGFPATVDFQTLAQEGNFPNDGTPSAGATATFEWGTVTYGGNTGAHFSMTLAPNTPSSCVAMANALAGMAEKLTVNGSTVIAPNTVSLQSSIPTFCGTGTGGIVFYGG